MCDIKKFTSLMKFRIYNNENKKFNYYGFIDDNNFINMPKDVNKQDIEECILKSCWYDEKTDMSANIHQKIKYNKIINMVKKNNYETFAILP